MKKRDGSPGAFKADTQSRRTLIKKALTLGSAGYVAPMILGSATPASAQAVSTTCNSSGCDVGCASGECACIDIVGGARSCVAAFCPDPVVTCDSSADCASDQVCMTTICCDEEQAGSVAICVFLCGAAVPPDGGRQAQPSPWGHAG